MKIVIVTLAMTTAGRGTFYNAQDIGLGRALAKAGHTIDIYDFVKQDEQDVFLSERLCIHYQKSRSIGNHSLHSYDFITGDADTVLCFSDNQIGFGRLKKRCDRVGVPCYPYVGVVASHSGNPIKRAVMDMVASNERYYRSMHVLAKTPQVKRELETAGAKDVTLMPVGLDESRLYREYEKTDKGELREQLGLPKQGRIILYLARLTQEKRPLEMLSIFADIRKTDHAAHLAVIGKGELQEQFLKKIEECNLRESVTYVESVPNAEVWQYFCASDVMVNLNAGEIFGMAILEAMYYGCPVVARSAPGPEFIIRDGTDGFIAEGDKEVTEKITELFENAKLRKSIADRAKEKVKTCFLWESIIKADDIFKK